MWTLMTLKRPQKRRKAVNKVSITSDSRKESSTTSGRLRETFKISQASRKAFLIKFSYANPLPKRNPPPTFFQTNFSSFPSAIYFQFNRPSSYSVLMSLRAILWAKFKWSRANLSIKVMCFIHSKNIETQQARQVAFYCLFNIQSIENHSNHWRNA